MRRNPLFLDEPEQQAKERGPPDVLGAVEHDEERPRSSPLSRPTVWRRIATFTEEVLPAPAGGVSGKADDARCRLSTVQQAPLAGRLPELLSQVAPGCRRRTYASDTRPVRRC